MFITDTPVADAVRSDVLPSDAVPSPAESCTAYLETLVSDSEVLASVHDDAAQIVGELDLGS